MYPHTVPLMGESFMRDKVLGRGPTTWFNDPGEEEREERGGSGADGKLTTCVSHTGGEKGNINQYKKG